MNRPPYIITDVFTSIVAEISAILATPVYSYYGYIKELDERLVQYNQSPASFDKKYPLVWLSQPFTITRVNADYYGDVMLRIFIIHQSEKTLKAAERMTQNFKPVMYPIYLELINAISNHTELFERSMNGHVPHDVTDRYYWENKDITDVIDCMEISNLKLKIANNPNCSVTTLFH